MLLPGLTTRIHERVKDIQSVKVHTSYSLSFFRSTKSRRTDPLDSPTTAVSDFTLDDQLLVKQSPSHEHLGVSRIHGIVDYSTFEFPTPDPTSLSTSLNH